MQIMVIGSEGYLGRPLCRRLVAHGLQVVRVDSLLYGQPADGVAVVGGYAEAYRYITAHEQRPDAIVLLAAYAHDPQMRIPDADIVANNAITPCEFARRVRVLYANRGPRVVAASSCSVFTEAWPQGYPESKRLLEYGLLTQEDWFRTTSIVRFGTLFGLDVADLDVWRRHLLLNSMCYDAVHSDAVYTARPEIRRPVTSLKTAVDTIAELLLMPPGILVNRVDCCGTLNNFAQYVASLRDTMFKSVTCVKTDAVASDGRDYAIGAWAPWNLREGVEHMLHTLTQYPDIGRVDHFEKFYKNVPTR